MRTQKKQQHSHRLLHLLLLLLFLLKLQLHLYISEPSKSPIRAAHNSLAPMKAFSLVISTRSYQVSTRSMAQCARIAAAMKNKVQNTSINLKFLLPCCFLAFLLLYVLWPSTLSSSDSGLKSSSALAIRSSTPGACTKIPPPLAGAILHYATSNVTPQQTLKEVSVTARVLERKSPCNFLVFGLGHDSLMWSALNHGGRTVFLEEDKAWIDTISSRFPELEAHHVAYDTKVSQADGLLGLAGSAECTAVGAADVRSSGCPLALKGLPSLFYEVEWDLIMVDAPTGYIPEAPGRMGAIYTAGMAARGRSEGETDVFVHDVDRKVEDKFSKAFLCEGYLKEQEGRLRHFTIPSHRASHGVPFCPSS